MKSFAALLLLFVTTFLPGCATAQAHAELPDAAPFDESVGDSEYAQKLDNAVAQLNPGRKVLAVFGANWCHDSRALAGWLVSPAFQDLLREDFEVVFIDVGTPQSGEGRNLDLAARYGVTGIEGTPTLLVIDHTGTLVNTPDDAKSWRNAASRSEGEIRAELARYAAQG